MPAFGGGGVGGGGGTGATVPSDIHADYQYEYGGLLIGARTPFITEKVDGLLGQPTLVQYHSKAQAKHGVFYGYEVFDARVVTIDVDIDGDPGLDIENKMSLFANSFSIAAAFQAILTVPLSASQIDKPFMFQRPGKGVRFIKAHVTKREFSSTGDVAMGLAKGTVELLAGDPRVYNVTSTTQAAFIAPTLNTSGTFVIHNAGNFPTPSCKVTITGPATNPVLTNITQGRAIRLNVTLLGTDVVVIDLAEKTIMLNGVNAYSIRANDSQWFEILPGDNSLVFSRGSTDAVAASLAMAWNDAWISA